MLNNLRDQLFKLNNKLYNYPAQLAILLSWIMIVSFSVPYLAFWFKQGIVIWASIFLFRVLMASNKKEYIKGLINVPLLGFIVGLNIIVLFSYLTIPLLFLINKKD